jgi:hypothetical protein
MHEDARLLGWFANIRRRSAEKADIWLVRIQCKDCCVRHGRSTSISGLEDFWRSSEVPSWIRRRSSFKRRRRNASLALQFHEHDFESLVANVLRHMLSSRSKHGLPRFQRSVL